MKFNESDNQIKGKVMGTIFAWTCATLSMGYLEIKLYSVCTLRYGEHIKENRSHFWMTAIQFYRVAKVARKCCYSL